MVNIWGRDLFTSFTTLPPILGEVACKERCEGAVFPFYENYAQCTDITALKISLDFWTIINNFELLLQEMARMHWVCLMYYLEMCRTTSHTSIQTPF